MSIDIYVATPTGFHVTDLNMANVNAADLFRWLGLNVGLWDGDRIPAAELAPICRRRLWDEKRNHDPEVPPEESRGPGQGSIVHCGRRAGYLREKTEKLLAICEWAIELHPEAKIYWG